MITTLVIMTMTLKFLELLLAVKAWGEPDQRISA
jgi:hypothetical protein